MSNKPDIWMPLYIGDYLADTSHLDAERHGCYLLWMMHYWRKGPLPNNIRDLVGVGCLRSADAPSIAKALLEEFFTLEPDGCWHQKRQDIEIAKATVKSMKAQEKAKRAANSRWGNDAPSNAPSNASSTPQAMLTPCPSQSQSEKEQKPSRAKAVPSKPSAECETLYGLYPRHIGKVAAIKAIQKALKLKPFDAMLLAVRAYVRKIEIEGTEEQFIPYPASWFNAGRYEDDMTPHPKNGNETAPKLRILSKPGGAE